MGGYIDGIEIVCPKEILEMQYDEVIIISLSGMNAIKKQLLEMGIPEYRINTSYIDLNVRARESFVRDYARIVYDKNLGGCVAEAGVFQGEFARIINECFSDKTLYLFDTFEGFDERDVTYEVQNSFSDASVGHLNITSEELVLEK